MSKHWNYRIIKHTDSTFGIYEVFYSDAGKVEMYSSDPCGFVSDSLDEMRDVLKMATEALSKPVLSIEDLPGYVE